MPKALIGVQTIAFRDYLDTKNDYMNAFKRVADIGYDGVQLGVGVKENAPCAKEIKEIMDEVGIVCTAMNAPFEKLEEHLDQVIADAKALDTKYIVIGASPEWVRTNGKEGFLDFAKRLNVVGEKLAAEGLYLHLHNHALEFRKYDGVTGMDILLENTDPRYVFFQLDTHWVQSGGGHVVSWIYKAKGRMKVVHFKDYLIDRYSDTSFLECTHRLYAEVGEGSLNWLDIIQACRDIGVEWFVTEQDRCVYRPPFEAIKISYDNLRNFGL